MDSPLVSIGMPVYNGERYLPEALDSLLAQDYPNIVITISDNASTDATEAICKRYAERDARIRYQRAARNMGAVWNFNRVFELSEGEFFMWAAFDDLRDPAFVSKCLAALQANPGAVLCYSDIRFIDERGEPVPFGLKTLHPTSESLEGRVSAMALSSFWYGFYGLMRADALAKTRLARPVWGFDVVLLMEVCLRGDVLFVPEQLFAYRVFTEKTAKDMAATLEPVAQQNSIPVSWSQQAFETARAVWLAPVALPHRLRLVTQFLWEFCVRHGAMHELVSADVRPALKRALAERSAGLFLGLLPVGGLVFSVRLARRVASSAQYRWGRIRRAL
ncbi:MAG: glycosyltransferase [Acidobacteria bacterium]|nr:glycosyltransferase [Acidobacteriota bacterium]